MSRSLVAEILDLTVRQGFDIDFTTVRDMDTWNNYFVIIVANGNYHQKIMIDINDLRSEAFYSIEDYIVKILEQSANKIITEKAKGEQK